MPRGYADTVLGQIHYRREGSGAPLLLLSASGRSSRMFSRLIPLIAPRLDTIALDTPGFGGSDPLPDGTSIEQIAEAVGNQFKVPYWEGSAVADELTQRGYPYVFRLNDNANAMAAGLTEVVVEMFAPKIGKDVKNLKIAMIHEDSAFGTSIAKDFEAQMKEKGVTLAAAEPYAANTQDLSSLVLRLKELKPDVLVATQYFNDAVLFWHQARNADYNPKYFAAIGAGQATPDYRKGVGDDSEGVLIADVPSAGVKPGALVPEAAELQNEFIKRYKAKMGKDPASHSTRHFSAMHVLLTKVLPKAGSFDPDKIKAAT
jgi:branched-chain amino acid transport system substrate-binding protein